MTHKKGYSSFLYINVSKKAVTSMNTINPAVTMLNIADRIMPVVVLKVLNSTVVSNVFLNDKLSFKAHSPGSTKSATTSIVPITLIDNTIVTAISKSNSIVKRFVGIPVIRAFSSSKIIESSSLWKKPMNDKTKTLRTVTSNKSEWLMVKMDPKR